MATGQEVQPEQWVTFSPIPVLVENLEQRPDRLPVIVEAQVSTLVASGDQVTHIETVDGCLALGQARVIMASNTLEAGLHLTKLFPKAPLNGKTYAVILALGGCPNPS
jgi:hypothetical protein